MWRLPAVPAAFSATVNQILHDEIARRRRHAALGALLDAMDAEDGPPAPGEVEAARALFT